VGPAIAGGNAIPTNHASVVHQARLSGRLQAATGLVSISRILKRPGDMRCFAGRLK
jgi:hypothetical protein